MRRSRRARSRVFEKSLDESTIDLKKIKMAHGGKRPGAGRKRGGQDDPKKALVKAADRIAAELAIAITGDIAALGKDRALRAWICSPMARVRAAAARKPQSKVPRRRRQRSPDNRWSGASPAAAHAPRAATRPRHSAG